MSHTEADVSDFETVSETSLTKRERYRQALDEQVLAPMRIVWSDWRARISLFIIAVYLLMGTVGVLVVPEPSPNQGGQLIGAFRTLEHPLGTTYSGHSILSQTVHATPAMLKMITAGAVFTVVIGTVLGTVSGYKGGTVDSVLMTLSDVALTIPGLPLIIVLAGALSGSLSGNPYVIGVLLSVNAWAGLARAIRSQVLTLRDANYVEASRIIGIPTREIIGKDIVPNLMPYITMNFVQQARAVIFGSVALYYLGILPYNSVNWGVMMDDAHGQAGAVSSPEAFHWLLIPMLAVVILALGLTLFAQAADRLFNPRVRARHAKTIPDDDGDDESDGPTTTAEMIN
ncbi:ABC transporter permease [Halegenticoccus tardaugens]|uniref:ABC transporter permease n=1 Tax=Halegenticoccus tardaugens TaxID=2071624 RepID=UPI001E301F1D|nr:ABC transporter permease [Halegenticoccus tardaugens]